jgi:hypothetical protein
MSFGISRAEPPGSIVGVTYCSESTEFGRGIYITLCIVFLFLLGLLTKSGSESSLSEDDDLKRGDRIKKEAEAQREEKESCSDEEKNKDSVIAEEEQCKERGRAVKTNPDEGKLVTQPQTQTSD